LIVPRTENPTFCSGKKGAGKLVADGVDMLLFGSTSRALLKISGDVRTVSGGVVGGGGGVVGGGGLVVVGPELPDP
jgi:hypothetical protein